MSQHIIVKNQLSISIALMFTHCPGSFGKSKTYVASADFKMIDLGKYSKSYGFLGFAFNMVDTKNYDIAYVRLVGY